MKRIDGKKRKKPRGGEKGSPEKNSRSPIIPKINSKEQMGKKPANRSPNCPKGGGGKAEKGERVRTKKWDFCTRFRRPKKMFQTLSV